MAKFTDISSLTNREIIEESYDHVREIPGRGLCGIGHFIFTSGLVVGITDFLYHGRYCYERLADAKEALETWDGIGDPPGPWIKYKGEGGERRNPNFSKT